MRRSREFPRCNKFYWERRGVNLQVYYQVQNSRTHFVWSQGLDQLTPWDQHRLWRDLQSKKIDIVPHYFTGIRSQQHSEFTLLLRTVCRTRIIHKDTNNVGIKYILLIRVSPFFTLFTI